MATRDSAIRILYFTIVDIGRVDNGGGLCPKPAYLQAPWIIGKRAFETDYCASLPGTAILAFKPRENPVNVG